MRLLNLALTTSLVCVAGSVSQPVSSRVANPRPANFREHTIATDLAGGYQVVVADLNRDGKPDLIGLASGLKEVDWFENPGWKRHVLVSGISRPINCAAYDLDGDGVPEIALAHEFSNNPAQSAGVVSLLKHKGDPLQPWDVTEIDRIPTSHRLRWADVEGNGRKVLINAPLAGRDAKPPDYNGSVPLVMYRPGSWKRETISQELQGVLHGILITDWDNDGRENVLTAGFLGVDSFSLGKAGAWVRTRLASGNPDPWPRGGASEIAVGRVRRERFFCTIEPWHGNQVAVYRGQRKSWRRTVIDTTLNDGHVLLTADLNNDRTDEIIAGYRGPGRSVYIYSLEDSKAGRWSRQTLDDGGMGAAGCAVADLNGDGLPDIACIGTATTNLKWYENLGPRRARN